MAEDVTAERRRLAAQLREQGAQENLVFGAVNLLGRTWPADLEAAAVDELLLEALKSFAVFPEWYERRMTAIRRRLLFAPQTPGVEALLGALAIQCQLNEYAWAEDAEETARAAELAAKGPALMPQEVMALACYRPLADLPFAGELLTRGWSGPVEEVLFEQIAAVRQELEIAERLSAVTEIRGGVSSDVRSQYEAHPYPRWRRAPKMALMRSIQGLPPPARAKVLVAGCGTGRQAIQAHELLDAAHTVAVDLSRRSLAYAARKTAEAGVSGIEYVHGDILELPARYPETFDLVTCVGVLHHMSDPFEGARAVCRTLKPGGFLNLGLYSAAARQALRAGQVLARDYTPETVRELRQAIFARPEGDPARHAVHSRDFYASSSARDLLMHVQEHQMTFADLRRILDENGLTLLGFLLPDNVMAAYRAAFPHDPQAVDMNALEHFETQHPGAFARMYMFWARKPEAPRPVVAGTHAADAPLGGVEDWKKPEARAAVLADVRRGALGTRPHGQPAIVHLRHNWPATDAAQASDELLAEVLKATPAYPYWFEGRLTALRRRLLLGAGVEALKPILPALAIQCFLNEYAWAEDAIERQLVERMATRVDRLGPDEAMVLACYRPLSAIPGAEALLDRGWTGGVAEVLGEQLAAPREERALAAEIPAITPIRAGASEAVRAHDEEGPYPRWRQVTRLPAVTAILGRPIPPSPDVLIAGCGTGFNAIHAGQRYGAAARILAVDLSRASLAYALRKTREAGLTGFEYAQADILELGGLDRRFDVVEASGVLHQMADPFEGARVLAGLLKPGGILRLGLHSRRARAQWAPAKALARNFTPATLHDLRQAIIAAPDGDPVKAAMGTTDFYATGTLRDLLMPVREHEHGIDDIRRMVAENGLDFMGFTPGAATLAAYRAANPDEPTGLDLARWDAFEEANPQAFAGMYLFWVRRPG